LPFKYLPDIALADIAFEVESESVNGLFADCAHGLSDIMVDPTTLAPRVSRRISLASEDLDRLLYDFLTELIVIKDVDSLLFHDVQVDVEPEGKALTADLRGEPIDRERHGLRNDVKAITMNLFGVRHKGKKWKATIVLDI
jgi:SHS2 domain-containing protein